MASQTKPVLVGSNSIRAPFSGAMSVGLFPRIACLAALFALELIAICSWFDSDLAYDAFGHGGAVILRGVVAFAVLLASVGYEKALQGIRATQRGEQPRKPEDPYLLRDAAVVLLDCGLRPEECHRLRWEHYRGDTIYVPHGKTINARREIPLSERAREVLARRRSESPWVFPAPTATGHIGQSSLKKQHAKACAMAKITPFVPYTFRHTCLTRWAGILDPYTLAYLAGHSHFGTTRRYVHPNLNTAREALERARKAHVPARFPLSRPA